MPTQVGNINPKQLSVLGIDNPYLPPEGNKSIPLLLDFVNFNQQQLDLLLTQQFGFISMLQTIYIDAKDTDASITVTVNSGQTIRVKGRTQGFYPLLCQSQGAKMTFLFDGTGANALVPVQLLNSPVPGVQWVTQ
jgi:uncharacterized ubiquitin-like protein YukD